MANTEDLLKRLGVSIDAGTLRLALTHRSFAYEHGGIPTNERLEFLGDSVLGLAVTDALYRDNPDLSEGDLAKRRSAVVSTRALAGIARELDLGEYVLLGQGEKLTNGKNKASILADTMEAIIGATYLDNGIEVARAMVMRLVAPLLGSAAAMGAGTDWKTSIQEIAAARRLGAIDYKVTGSGPDHARTFEALLMVGGLPYGSGSGPSKKEAEQEAAAASWKMLRHLAHEPKSAAYSVSAPANGTGPADASDLTAAPGSAESA
ncbi:ribonuclease III [Arthrobacter sp. Bz4]|uniref:ribonuclease III n=1 Tax=Arthrobacter sp. Bz4 TaxID=2171979 RepID=UPI000D513C0C|nr:ribonuclease III [Arthrobacter sp. Bz4]PVE20083.1 ribonuclease III [Arthrobacter sp. Bz4]